MGKRRKMFIERGKNLYICSSRLDVYDNNVMIMIFSFFCVYIHTLLLLYLYHSTMCNAMIPSSIPTQTKFFGAFFQWEIELMFVICLSAYPCVHIICLFIHQSISMNVSPSISLTARPQPNFQNTGSNARSCRHINHWIQSVPSASNNLWKPVSWLPK